MATSSPCAWSALEFANILTNAQRLDRTNYKICEIPAAAWWDAFARIAWDSTLRVGDILNLEFAQLASDGSLIVVQQKTGQAIAVQLSVETLAAIDRIRMPQRSRILPWSTTRLQFGRCYRRLFRPTINRASQGGVA